MSIILNKKYNLNELMQKLSEHYIISENEYVKKLISMIDISHKNINIINAKTYELICNVRNTHYASDAIDELLQEYKLDTYEGIQLMCIAEALLRIPDNATADAFIKDKLCVADWKSHLGNSKSWLVNAATWGLFITGRVVYKFKYDHPITFIISIVNKIGEYLVRKAMKQAIKIIGWQFVQGRDINEALNRSQSLFKKGYTYSYDMLGEAALTINDAERYFNNYVCAIRSVGKYSKLIYNNIPDPSISIKLSALHPRYNFANRNRVIVELVATFIEIVKIAREHNVSITIDAEEADRLELSLEVFYEVYISEICKYWGGLGIVVQAYSKRALPTLHWLTQLSNLYDTPIPVRLVKGAYWDAEIKYSQQLGLEGYPVFTIKACTDISYIACVTYMLSKNTLGKIFPQFATHNAHTISTIINIAEYSNRTFEFQRLHGMGEALYDIVLTKSPVGTYCRIYAPVGTNKDLLPYLVRRLLENGANSSFVHQLFDPNVSVESISVHPFEILKKKKQYTNENIPIPQLNYNGRITAHGINTNISSQYNALIIQINHFIYKQWEAMPLLGNKNKINKDARMVMVRNSLDYYKFIGKVYFSSKEQIINAIDIAYNAFPRWNRTSVKERINIIERFADALEANMPELIAICALEAGKHIVDGIADIREAIDFCRYYAIIARELLINKTPLPGPTGEINFLSLEGKGVFATISPCNFPVAIFCGQIVAAALTGNTVIAKPAEQTSIIAYRSIQLLYESGMPRDVVQLLLGDGYSIGKLLTSDTRIIGIAFTGSNENANLINSAIALRNNAHLTTIIAETGGINAMIVDSTALLEKVVIDVIESAFRSCSSLRILYLQEEIYTKIITLIKGAMHELIVGDPTQINTDVGPVININVRDNLLKYIENRKIKGELIFETPFIDNKRSALIAPVAIIFKGLTSIKLDNFGPILHIATFKYNDIDSLISSINENGYGITFGIHSRNEKLTQYIVDRIQVGNIYVNRNLIGAFGVRKSSGPKAGGHNYLLRFVNEKKYSN
ncbi:Bifunctional protein putA [Candidatus Johnevansia muelleri]|uniref:Bifunctional protein PutA n=1 Tax=Candidatus Johnevansia muelleri TaxID=1495769 RepID=A0A078KEK7_9GAMM|nr:Bifunctional protein putA [Candidatus Evansia muelleri]